MLQKTKIARKTNGASKAELVELLMQHLQPHLQAQVESWLNRQFLEIAAHQSNFNPFAIRYSDYTEFSENEERELRDKIYMENYEWIESELARRKAEWMIVVNGQILKSSSTLDNIPTQPQLDRLGKKRGFMPFLFVRNVLIEESMITNHNATSWSKVALNDFLDGQNRKTEIVE